jgi:hypothetical protein
MVQSVADDALEVFVPEGRALGPVLEQIGRDLAVRDIETHPVTLHDVYVQAIAKHNASVEAGAS